MASFSFSLEGVLRQRKLVEQQAQRFVATIQAQMTVLEAELRAMDNSVKSTTDDLRQNRLVGRIDLSFLAAHRRYTLAMQRKAMELAQKMAGVQLKIDEARKAWTEAAKRRKAIEKLRERHLERWSADMARRERAETDEIGMQLSYRADAREAGARMKKLFVALMMLLAINFMAVGGAVGWLWKSGHLDKGKITQVKDILFPPPAAPATQPSDDGAASKTDALEKLLARQTGHTATEQVQFIQKTFDAQMLQVDRRTRELSDLKRQVDLANLKLASDRESLEKQKKALADREQEASRLETDKGFQDSLALYEAMPAKQVKTIFMGLSDQIVMQYLQAMSPRNASKIIKEFKSSDETVFIEKVLEMMRATQASTASAAAPPAEAAAGNK